MTAKKPPGPRSLTFLTLKRRRQPNWPSTRPVTPFPNAHDYGVQVRLRDFSLHRPRQWGACWVGCRLSSQKPETLWQFYIQLTQVQEAFKDVKGDLAIRPIFHQDLERIEAHIMVAFLAYCLHATLKACLKRFAPGLTPRSALEKFAAIQMLDVHFPTTDGRELVFRRHTQPEKDHKMILAQLNWELPPQSPPRITQKGDLLDN